MFAYCNNNPANYEDSSGCALKPCTVIMCDGPTLDMIEDQTAPPYADTDLGSASVAHGGCGPVATYNAMQLLGRTNVEFGEIVDYYKNNNGTVMGGLLGTSFDTMVSYFESKGFDVDVLVAGEISSLAGIEKNYDVGVVLFGYFRNDLPYYGSHYVAFAQYGDAACYYNYGSWNGGGRIPYSGYTIDFLKQNRDIPMKMLLISMG